MTRQQLEEYRSKKAEIVELKYKLENLARDDSMIGNNVILDYRTGYPRPQSVVGWDYERESRLRDAWEKRLGKLETECMEVEAWIEAIPDSMTRRIFRMYYMDGMRQNKIAKIVYATQSVVSEKISTFLKSDKNDKKVW